MLSSLYHVHVGLIRVPTVPHTSYYCIIVLEIIDINSKDNSTGASIQIIFAFCIAFNAIDSVC